MTEFYIMSAVSCTQNWKYIIIIISIPLLFPSAYISLQPLHYLSLYAMKGTGTAQREVFMRLHHSFKMGKNSPVFFLNEFLSVDYPAQFKMASVQQCPN